MVQNNRRQVARLAWWGSVQFVLMLQHQSHRANHSLSLELNRKTKTIIFGGFSQGSDTIGILGVSNLPMQIKDLSSFIKKEGWLWGYTFVFRVYTLSYKNQYKINSSPNSTMCQKSTSQHFVCRRADAIPKSWTLCFSTSQEEGVQT